jgi:hypothetical protein
MPRIPGCGCGTLARKLREDVKLTPEQAEGFARALAETYSAGLASKADLELAVAKINGDLLVLKWMVGAILAGLLSLIVKTFYG